MYCSKMSKKCSFVDYCKPIDKELPKNSFFNTIEKVDIEEILFEMWLKDVILYQYIKLNDLERFIKSINLRKEHIIWTYSVIELESYSQTRLKDWFLNVPVATNKEKLRSFINYDTSADYRIRNIWTWHLLWYPDCCIKNAVQKSSSIEKLKEFERKKPKINKCPLIWWKTQLYAHIPCSNSCVKTIDLAEKVLLYLSKLNGENIIGEFFIKNNINYGKIN